MKLLNLIMNFNNTNLSKNNYQNYKNKNNNIIINKLNGKL